MHIRGAKAIVLDPEGNVLIVRRSNTHPFAPLTDDIPGGKVEEGETMIEGLARELSEETGIDITKASVRKISSNHAENYYGNDYSIELYEVQLSERVDVVLDYEHDMFAWKSFQDAQMVGELYEDVFNSYKSEVLQS